MSDQRLSASVRRYVDALALLGKEARQPGSFPQALRELEAIVDTERFERVVGLGQTRNWADHVGGLAQWLATAELQCEIVDLDEAEHVVFAEMNERTIVNGEVNVLHTLAVYDFTDEGRIARLTSYAQKAPEA